MWCIWRVNIQVYVIWILFREYQLHWMGRISTSLWWTLLNMLGLTRERKGDMRTVDGNLLESHSLMLPMPAIEVKFNLNQISDICNHNVLNFTYSNLFALSIFPNPWFRVCIVNGMEKNTEHYASLARQHMEIDSNSWIQLDG